MKSLLTTLCLTIIVLLGSVNLVEAQTNDDGKTATLYRTSMVTKDARIHIATFNADKNSGGGGFSYNWENCNVAAKLFQNQGGVKTRFWCEKGTYKK